MFYRLCLERVKSDEFIINTLSRKASKQVIKPDSPMRISEERKKVISNQDLKELEELFINMKIETLICN